MWRVMTSSIRAHKGRLIRTSIAVVLGVSFVAGTFVLTDTLNRVFNGIVTNSTLGTDIQVRSSGFSSNTMQMNRPPVRAALLGPIENVRGVQDAWGMVQGFAQLIGHDGKPAVSGMAPTFGLSWAKSPGVSIREGHPPQGANQVVIDAATAKREGFRVGDRVKVLLGGPAQTFTVVGIAGFGNADNLAGATMTLFDLPTAQHVFGKDGEFDTIEVTVAPGYSPAEVRSGINLVIPPGVEALSIAKVQQEQQNAFDYFLGFFRTALLVFATIALLVGAFVIFNTFSIIVAQRTREFALLRSLGASPRQVLGAVVGEAMIIGLLASIVGLGLGIALAFGLKALIAGFGMSLPSGGLVILPRTAIVAIAVGLIVTAVASITPGRRAARVPPIAAMRDVARTPTRSLTSRTVLGIALSALGLGVLFVGLFTGVANQLAYVGGGALLLFVGIGALSPVLAGPLAAVLGAALPRLAGISGHLARDNAMRNRKRTATTASALMVGVALIAFVAIFSSSIKASATGAFERSIRAERILTGGTSVGVPSTFSRTVGRQLAKDPAVAVASPVRIGQWSRPGDTSGLLYLAAVDPHTIGSVVNLDMKTGSLAALNRNQVLLSETTAKDLGVSVGDTIKMEFPITREMPVRVGGTYDDAAATVVQGDYVISLASFERNFPVSDQRDWRVYVKGAPGSSPSALDAAIGRTIQPYPNVDVMTPAQLQADIAKQVDALMGLIQALLGLAIVIAVVGIANTLGLSILERTRELGLLRAVGMSRRQTRSMVRWEAVIIALIGSLIGLAVGAFLGWSVVMAMKSLGITDFRMPGIQLAVYLIVAAMAGVVAAMLPARRAARLDVLTAIATE
jgi:putative ABC transport system permease protein